jgi:hypothetical protein
MSSSQSTSRTTDQLLSLRPEEQVSLSPEELDALINVELEAYGPPKLVEDVSTLGVGPFDEPCTVCMDPFTGDPDESPGRELHACRHPFHTNCLDTLINEAYRTDVMCPVCRAKICDSRMTRKKVKTSG